MTDSLAERALPDPLLRVERLDVRLRLPSGDAVHAVRRVSFELAEGETLAIVGESGSGKSSLGLALSGLGPAGCEAEISGRVMLGGRDVLALDAEAVRRLRGNEISFVFQSPDEALNPTQRIGAQIEQIIRTHRDVDRDRARHEAADLLARVHIPDPEHACRRYPHEFSGGMRQRAVIALALANRPAVVVADEPTSALDVLVQERLLELFQDMRAATGMSMLFITHDIGVASRLADRVMVMYAGQVVEIGTAAAVLGSPRHAYTRALLEAAPAVSRAYAPGERLRTPAGSRPGEAA